MVMPMTSVPSASTKARAPASGGRLVPSQTPAADQLEQLTFLHEVARLATTARTWDELLETVVDRTRDVLHADVSSLYLLDRDGAYLTLAATNGLDRYQIGRARVPFGEGVTGSVAAERRPLVIPDVKDDARFLWVRGIDQRRFSSMLSVPLTWHDQIVGVLNVQTERRARSARTLAQRAPSPPAGHHRKGRRNRRPAVEALKAIDEARSERSPWSPTVRAAGDRPRLRRPAGRRPPCAAQSRDMARRRARRRNATPRGIRGPTGWSTDPIPRCGSCRRAGLGHAGRPEPPVDGWCPPGHPRGPSGRDRPASGSTPWPTHRGSARPSSTRRECGQVRAAVDRHPSVVADEGVVLSTPTRAGTPTAARAIFEPTPGARAYRAGSGSARREAAR
jgi:putative methionine-R-sulfoxide reductase with GAF domain